MRRFSGLLGLLLCSGVGLGPALAAEEPRPQPAAEPLAPLAAEPAPVEPAAEPAAEAADRWAYTLEAYGFVPWVTATTTVQGFTADTDLAPGQILKLLQSVVSVRASAETGRLGLQTDLSYTQLGSQNSVSTRRGLFTGSSTVTSINGTYDLALRYRLGARESAVGKPGTGWWIPYAGVRLLQAELGVEAELEGNGPLALRWQRQGNLNRTWAQLLLGSQASVFVSPGLRLFARGDIGGFGLAGAQDLSGNAQVGVGVALGNNTDLNLSWRYMGIAYSNGAARATGYTSHQNGVELGVKFFF